MTTVARGVVCLCLAASAGCAPRFITVPTDPGAPWPDYAQVHAAVSAACRGVRTLQAELSLSGRAGRQRLRGRVHAGFERPASMRLEGVAPFGPPAFILAAREHEAVLLLPRDSRVVRDASAEDVLGALTGVTLAPAELQAALSGCVSAQPRPVSGRRHGSKWASIELEDDITLYLQQRQQRWELRAARRGAWQIDYPSWAGAFPQTVRLRSGLDESRVELTADVSQLSVNELIREAAFTVQVPPGFSPLSLEELRAAGPLRDASE